MQSPIDIPTLPLHLLDLVIDVLGEEKDVTTLRAVSQTSCSMAHSCRRYLFSDINILDNLMVNQQHPRLSSLDDLLQKQPYIADYIKKFTCGIVNDIDSAGNILRLPRILNRLSRLQSFTLSCGVPSGFDITSWDEIDPSIKLAIERIMQLETLFSVDLASLPNFPAHLYLTCPNLDDLTIGQSTKFKNDASFNTQISNPSACKPRLRSITIGAGVGRSDIQPEDIQLLPKFLNLSELESLSIEFADTMQNVANMGHLFRIVGGAPVRKLNLDLRSIYDPYWLAGLASSINQASLTNLRKIKIASLIDCNDSPLGELYQLASEIGDINALKTIEEIEMEVDYGSYFDYPGDSIGGWMEIDEVLSQTALAPALRRVSVHIVLWVCRPIDYIETFKQTVVDGGVILPTLLKLNSRCDIELFYRVSVRHCCAYNENDSWTVISRTKYRS